MREKETEEKVTTPSKKTSPTILAHFAMLSRGNCWLSVEGIPEPIPLAGGDCFLAARGTSFVLRDSPQHVPGVSAKARPRPTAQSFIMEVVARRRQSSVDP
jgi:hypothetical protein